MTYRQEQNFKLQQSTSKVASLRNHRHVITVYAIVTCFSMLQLNIIVIPPVSRLTSNSFPQTSLELTG